MGAPSWAQSWTKLSPILLASPLLWQKERVRIGKTLRHVGSPRSGLTSSVQRKLAATPALETRARSNVRRTSSTLDRSQFAPSPGARYPSENHIRHQRTGRRLLHRLLLRSDSEPLDLPLLLLRRRLGPQQQCLLRLLRRPLPLPAPLRGTRHRVLLRRSHGPPRAAQDVGRLQNQQAPLPRAVSPSSSA